MKRYTIEFANSLITSYSVLNERGEVPQVCKKISVLYPILSERASAGKFPTLKPFLQL